MPDIAPLLILHTRDGSEPESEEIVCDIFSPMQENAAEWGVLLADVVRHLGIAYEATTGRPRVEVIMEIWSTLQAEMSDPTATLKVVSGGVVVSSEDVGPPEPERQEWLAWLRTKLPAELDRIVGVVDALGAPVPATSVDDEMEVISLAWGTQGRWYFEVELQVDGSLSWFSVDRVAGDHDAGDAIDDAARAALAKATKET